MKNILCFGDSNTFGFNPLNGSRFTKEERWSGILKEKLSKLNYEVVEAGANNRSCFIKNELDDLTGYLALPKYLNKEFDYVILAIGINDLQKFYRPTNDEIKEGLKRLIDIIKDKNNKTKILILSPSNLTKDIFHSYFINLFDEVSIKKSKEIFELYKSVAADNNCDIINLNEVSEVSTLDGLHYDINGHKKIVKKLYEYFLNLE